MSLQVDFLNKTERRYQGIVSMKVMVLGSASVLIGVTFLVLSLAGISKVTLSANLDRTRGEWKRLEPLDAGIRSAHAAAAANRLTLAKLQSRAQGDRMEMHRILRAAQSRIPAQMVLNNFYAGLEQTAADNSAYYTLRFTGQSVGELTAVEAKRRLNEDAELRRFCGEIKLVSSQREAGENWGFALEGRRPAEEGGK